MNDIEQEVRAEAVFATAQHNAYVVMRNDPGIWNDSLRRALDAVLPMVWREAQTAEREQASRPTSPATREAVTEAIEAVPLNHGALPSAEAEQIADALLAAFDIRERSE